MIPGRWTTTRRRLAGVVFLAVAATVTASCGPSADDLATQVEELRSDLRSERQQRLEAQETLEQRLDELGTSVEEFGTDDGTEARLDEIDELLTGLTDSLTQLESDLAGETTARTELADAVEAADRDLRGGLTEAREDLDALRGSVGLLSDQVDVLRERLDRADG